MLGPVDVGVEQPDPQPARWSASARLVATVLLPTPPLPLITRTTFLTPGTGSSLVMSRPMTRTSEESVDRRRSRLCERGRRLGEQTLFQRRGRGREHDPRGDLARRVDRDVLDQAELGDRLVKIGMADLAERVERRFAREGHERCF